MSTFRELFYSGMSGLNLPFPRSQYPAEFREKSRLEYYASLFNSLEINSCFYKLPQSSTVAKWAETVPADFRFTCKISKTITHAKNLQFSQNDITDFMNVMENIRDKKGCLLAQFPPSFKIGNVSGLQKLLEALGEAIQNTKWKLAIEFRDPSWYEQEIFELLEEVEATLVIHDIPKSATPLHKAVGDFIYLRFHGPEPRYRGDYSDETLKRYAGYIHDWISEKKTVYAYMNNTAGAAFKNLQTLNSYVNENNESSVPRKTSA